MKRRPPPQGRDEFNLAEFPITLLTSRQPKGINTLVFENGNGKLIVSGSDAYGLPTASDADVIVGLLQLSKQRNDFTDPKVTFTRHELLELMGWPSGAQYYNRLKISLRRWNGVSLFFEGSFYNKSNNKSVDASFHILESVVITSPLSSFTWNDLFWNSCNLGNIKKLDTETYFALESSITKRLYRFLDKRFYRHPAWHFDLQALAFGHIGLSPNYSDAKIKEKLKPALTELEKIGFLRPMDNAERYITTNQRRWRINLVKAGVQTTVEEKQGQEGHLFSV